MLSRTLTSTLFSAFLAYTLDSNVVRAVDPCAVIGGQKWAAPADVRACFQSFPLNETVKSNIIEVVNKTVAFHTSTNYEIRAPEPFASQVHQDVIAELARIKAQNYATDFDLHVDLSRTMRKTNDGHSVYINQCYDSLFISYLPIPLVLLDDTSGNRGIYIAPDAFTVASSEFADQISIWQNAVNGQLESLSGAAVLSINGADPWVDVNANAEVTGSFQSFATRQNSYFASYTLSGEVQWTYVMGQFAQKPLPLNDTVTLTIRRTNSSSSETVTLPYRARLGPGAVAFTDSASFWNNNCLPISSTNGADLYDTSLSKASKSASRIQPGGIFGANPPVEMNTGGRPPMLDVLLDVNGAANIPMPAELQPPRVYHASDGPVAFYILPDGKTAVIALGSFSYPGSEISFMVGFINGLTVMGYYGAQRFIIDVSNNSGGLLCPAAYLHRVISGSKSTTNPQALFNTQARSNPLAQQIVKNIIAGADPNDQLLYNPAHWKYANHTAFPDNYNWLATPVQKTINGRSDAFSQELGQECQPFYYFDLDDAPMYNTSQIAIVSNGRCASSCALFATTMVKEEGSIAISIGGEKGRPQEYAGTVGGQSTDFASINTEIKTTGLKNHSLAPPDFLTNSYQGITWRLALGAKDRSQPEEWQSRQATVNIGLTTANVNQPWLIWQDIAAKVFGA